MHIRTGTTFFLVFLFVISGHLSFSRTASADGERNSGRQTTESSDRSNPNSDSESDSKVDVSAELEQIQKEVSESTGSEDNQSNQNQSGSNQSLNPDISVIMDTGFAWLSDKAEPIGGPDPKEFGFFFQGAELAVDADVDPYFTFDAFLVAKLGGLKVGEAYATSLSLPGGLQWRIGKFKTRFGRLNPTHLHRWHFSTLPLVNAKFFGPAGLNGLGTEISQLLPLPWYVEWSLAVQSLPTAATGRSFIRNQDRIDTPLDLTASGRLKQFFELDRNWSFLWGLNYAIGRNDSEPPRDHRTDIFATDLFLKWKSSTSGGRSEVGWQTEAMVRRRASPSGKLVDHGLYSLLYWQPTRQWELGTRYDYVTDATNQSPDYLHPDWTQDRQRASVEVAYLPTEFSRLRIEYGADRLEYLPDHFEHSVTFQAQFVTGSHGAHKF